MTCHFAFCRRQVHIENFSEMENEIKTQVKIEKSSPKLSEFDRKIRRRGFSSSSSSCDSPERSRSPLSDRKSSRKSSRRKRSQRSRHHSRCRSKSRSRTPGHHHRMRYYGTRENPHKSRVVGIFGLSNSSNEATLMDVFAPFGPIEHVQIIYDRQTEKSRGFGFIYFKEIETATKARTTCNGMSLDGKRIRVDYSITKRAHTPTPGETKDFYSLSSCVLIVIVRSSFQAFTWEPPSRTVRRNAIATRTDPVVAALVVTEAHIAMAAHIATDIALVAATNIRVHHRALIAANCTAA